MGFPSAMINQSELGLKPFGAFRAVMSAEAGEVFGGLCVFPLGEVVGGEEVSFDLIDVPMRKLERVHGNNDCLHGNQPRLSPRLRDGTLIRDAHCDCVVDAGAC